MFENFPLQVFVFNVGQGDNILLRLPDGSFGFIDFFHNGIQNPAGEPPSLTFVKNNASPKIKNSFVHLSHYHLDHIKGMEKWIDWAKDKDLAQIWLPGIHDPMEVLEIFIKVLNNAKLIKDILKHPEHAGLIDRYNKIKKNYEKSIFPYLKDFINRHEGIRGETEYMIAGIIPNAVSEPEEVKSFCLCPHKKRVKQLALANPKQILLYLLNERKHINSDGNDISAVLLLVYKQIRLLFSGDATHASLMESMQYLVKHSEVCNNYNFEADFVKVPHHGSKHSSDVVIWENILPENSEAVLLAISSGDHKKFEHPDQETLDHIHEAANKKNAKIGVYSTNGKGDRPHDSILVGEMRVKWPDGKKRQEVGNKLDNNLAALGLVTRGQLYPSSQDFLGYCFEFDPDNATEPIRVMRVFPESAILVP